MRKLLTSLFAAALAAGIFSPASAEEPIWVPDRGAITWDELCSDFSEYVPNEILGGTELAPNLECIIDIPIADQEWSENPKTEKTRLAYTDDRRVILVDVNALSRLWDYGLLKPYGENLLGKFEDSFASLAFPSTLKLLNDEPERSVQVTERQVKQLCANFSGRYIRDGFYPLLAWQTYDYATNQMVKSYGPACMVAMKPTMYWRTQSEALGYAPVAEDALVYSILTALDENGNWYIDYSLLEENGLLESEILVNEVPVPLWSYLNCRSSFSITAENGETYEVTDSREACQPGSPANAENMDAPPPFMSLINR